ncbi:MAG TPA: ribonuclease [Devosia sp.]|jgi:ribonuclease T2|uniref:ribonuclease T2 family protein n=1 Tax=Devosia sp. TaxID=1871048 RepID=UPI002F940C19
MRLPLLILTAVLLVSPALAQERTQYVLAISWQPAFCETRPSRPECQSQTADRFDSSHFALHGLWPQPRSRDYCGVKIEDVAADERGAWSELPAPDISDRLEDALAQAMPGTQSDLDRHEWIKHGTCYGSDAKDYFSDSLAMLEAVNGSAVAELFAASIGKRLTQSEIRAAFNGAFGPGAGERVRVSCIDDGNRRLIDELTIGLTGEIRDSSDFAERILAARPTEGGCDAGIVDQVGLQ